MDITELRKQVEVNRRQNGRLEALLGSAHDYNMSLVRMNESLARDNAKCQAENDRLRRLQPSPSSRSSPTEQTEDAYS